MNAFDAQTSIAENLAVLTGEMITVQLTSGQELQGKLKDIGVSLLHLEGLVGRDFYDALIDISQISAVIIRVRS